MIVQIAGCNITTCLDRFEGVDGPLIVLECEDMRVIIRADELDDVKLIDLDYIEISITRKNGDVFVIKNEDRQAYLISYVLISEFLKMIKCR